MRTIPSTPAGTSRGIERVPPNGVDVARVPSRTWSRISRRGIVDRDGSFFASRSEVLAVGAPVQAVGLCVCGEGLWMEGGVKDTEW